MNLWLHLKNQVLLRRVPHGVISWRYLLPGQSDAVKLHRRVFLGGWPTLNRFGWFLITLYSLTLWYGFYSWWLLLKAFFQRRRRLQEEFDVAPQRHLFDLFRLCLLNGIAPGAYYQYQLFRQPEKQWLNYIYDQELPHWHRVLSGKLSNDSLERISDKRLFCQTMQRSHIDCVDTACFVPQGDAVPREMLFSKKSWFGKRNQGNQGIGAFALIYDADRDHYLLKGDPDIEERQAIVDAITALTKERDYLLQPLLHNHPDVAELCGTETLCTLRVVTALAHEPLVMHATLEIPIENKFGYIYPVKVDSSSGQLCAPAYPRMVQSKTYENLISTLAGRHLPYWSEVKQLSIRAHAQFQDVATIGWDVVILPDGVKLLEGNLNWGVSTSQVLDGVGALDTELGCYYRHYFL